MVRYYIYISINRGMMIRVRGCVLRVLLGVLRVQCLRKKGSKVKTSNTTQGNPITFPIICRIQRLL